MIRLDRGVFLFDRPGTPGTGVGGRGIPGVLSACRSRVAGGAPSLIGGLLLVAWLGGELAGRFAFTAEARFPGCAELAGEVEVLEPWIDPDTGRPAAISRDRLRRLAQRFLPIEVSGDPIQYQIHRAPLGWTVELVNNRGVAKRPDRPAVIDAKAVARVRLKPRMACKAARGWRSSRIHEDASPAEVEIGPGAVEFVEFAAGE